MLADEFSTLFDALLDQGRKPQVWLQGVILLGSMLVAWLAARGLRTRLHRGLDPARLGQVVSLADVVFPACAWVCLLAARFVAERLHQPAALLRLGVVLAGSFVLVRLVVYVLRRVFAPSGPLVAFERVIVVLVWSAVALYLMGWLGDVLAAADNIEFALGKTRLSLLLVLQGVVTVGVTVIVALWAGAALEARLMGVQGMDASLRVVLARVGNALLLVVAILVSLSLVGIDLTVLSVFGGALGVGLGLGFQRIASSYVSGFIILLDRSLRIGDLISVDKYQGTVSQIRTRYTVVRALDGTDAIIPNDLLVSQPVLNHSFADTRVRVAMKVTVALDADIDRALGLMVEAARQAERVLADPAPTAFMVGLGTGGVELEVGFWINDPERGSGRIKSAIFQKIWADFRANAIYLPADPAQEVARQVVSGLISPPSGSRQTVVDARPSTTSGA